MMSKYTKDAENVYAPLVLMSIGAASESKMVGAASSILDKSNMFTFGKRKCGLFRIQNPPLN
jgi:hypothetical protein